MGLHDLAVVALQQVRENEPCKTPGRPEPERRAVMTGFDPHARGLDAHQIHLGIAQECPKGADRVRNRRPRTRSRSPGVDPPAPASGRAPSVPMTDWKSATISGYGAGPTADPIT